jgi:hypothetical protein
MTALSELFALVARLDTADVVVFKVATELWNGRRFVCDVETCSDPAVCVCTARMPDGKTTASMACHRVAHQDARAARLWRVPDWPPTIHFFKDFPTPDAILDAH